jgi:excisionase family DNA binding protein
MTTGADYLRATDVVRLTGISLRTVRRWIAGNVLPSTKLGGARFVARADLQRLLYSSPNQAEGGRRPRRKT